MSYLTWLETSREAEPCNAVANPAEIIACVEQRAGPPCGVPAQTASPPAVDPTVTGTISLMDRVTTSIDAFPLSALSRAFPPCALCRPNEARAPDIRLSALSVVGSSGTPKAFLTVEAARRPGCRKSTGSGSSSAGNGIIQEFFQQAERPSGYGQGNYRWACGSALLPTASADVHQYPRCRSQHPAAAPLADAQRRDSPPSCRMY